MAILMSDLADWLETSLLVTGEGTDLFVDYTPETPEEIVVIAEYAGNDAKIDGLYNRSIQVSVRCKKSSDARTKAWDILKAMTADADYFIQLTASRWGVFRVRQTPFKLAVEGGLTTWAFNVGITTVGD